MATEPRRLEQVSAADMAPLEALFEPGYPERLREMAVSIYLALADAGRETPPHELALAVTERISLDLGGSSWYMHKGYHYRLSQRDRQIMAEYNGRNLHLLAKKHNLTEMRLRQIIAARQDEKNERDQQRLDLGG